ncbi:MAG: hypothetical protein JJT94_17560, partial [Bernardetiaceae bacterium]|nr:hypothetical protein [Bernardetiaceae bacterium]
KVEEENKSYIHIIEYDLKSKKQKFKYSDLERYTTKKKLTGIFFVNFDVFLSYYYGNEERKPEIGFIPMMSN